MFLLSIVFFLTILLFPSLSLLICDASCLTCTGSASNQCLTCQSALIPSSGSCVCPDGKYATSGFTACASCNSICSTCTGPAATDCTGCSTGTFLYGGTCYTNCSSSNYFNASTLTCQSCDSSCLTCSGSSSSSCSSCTSGTLVSGSCKCNSGQYKDSSYVCQGCDSTCKECSGSSSSNCTACATGLILQSNQCTCPTGTYLNLSPISCLNCSSLCQGCTGSSASSCTSCKNNMILTSSTCTCPTRTYFEATSISCQSCDSTCQECSGPSNSQCTSCRNNLQLSSGQCTCPSNAYLDTTSMICVACDSSCQTCSGSASNQCTSCATSFSLSANGQCQCSSGCSCPDGTYFESTSLTCMACHSSCTTCSGPASNQCLTCGTDESLSSGACICSSSCTCADGTYFDSGTSSCAACDETCLTCSGAGSTECVLCKNNMVPSGGECVCSTGTYLNSYIMTCLSCDSTCLECSGPAATQCNSCKNNMITLSSLECGCPSTYYLDQGTLTCKTCDTHCQECTGPEKSQCTSCESTQVLQNGYCWDICSSNQYRDTADGSCQDCDSSCAECSGSGANECTSCSSDRDLISGECVIHCDSSCSTCIGSSASQCTSCSGSLVLQIVASNYGSCIAQVVTPIVTPVVTEKKKITNLIGYGSSSTDIKITMDQTIQNEYNSIISLIQLSIVFTSAQPSIDYSYSYRLNSNYKEIIISFTYSGHLLAGNILNVDYTSIQTNTSLDYYMANTLQQIRLQESYQYSTSAQSFINGTTAVATASSQANGVFSLTSSFALKTVHSMRSEIVEDMLSFFIYMNIDYPPNFVSFSVNDGGDQFSFIPDLGELIVDSSGDSSRRRVLQEESNTTESAIEGDNAIDRYVPSLIFLVNFGSTLTMSIIAFGVILLIEGLKLLFPYVDKSKHFVKYLCHKVLAFTSNSLRWSFMVNQFIAVYLNLAFFSLLEVSNVRPLKGAVGYIKYISGIIGLLVSALSTIVLPLLARKAFLILKKSKNKQENQNPKEKEFLRKFNIIYFPFNTEKFAQFMYPPLLVIRSFGFVLFLVFLQKAPLAQALYIIISTVLMIVFLAKVKPLKSKVQQILTILYEVCFLAAGTAALSIYIYTENHVSDITVRSNLGYTIICCSLTMTVLNIINMIIELSELKHVLKKCRKRKRVTPLIPLSKNVSESETPHNIPLKEEDVVSDYPDDKVQLKKENLKTIQEEDNLGKTGAEISMSNTARTGQAWSRRMLLGNPKLNFDGKSLNDTIENLSLHTTPSKETPMNNLKESRKLDSAEREYTQPEILVVTPLKSRNLLSLKTKGFFAQKEFISTFEELDLLRPEQQQKPKARNLLTPKRLALNSKEALSTKELMFKFDSKLSKDSQSIIENGSRTGEDLLKKRDGDLRKFDTERDIWVEDMGMNTAKSGQSGKGGKKIALT